MGNTVRFGISLDDKLLQNFDQLIERKSYRNRSEAIRDLIRASLVEEICGYEDQESVGTVTLVYNHHVRDLSDKLTEHQHSHHDQIISSLHVHLDAHNCLEVLNFVEKVEYENSSYHSPVLRWRRAYPLLPVRVGLQSAGSLLSVRHLYC